MPTSNWIRGIVFASSLFWVFAAWLLGEPIGDDYVRAVGCAASVLVVLVLLFDIWLWRFLPEWLVRIPNLRGTWRAVIEYGDKDGPIGTADCFLVIRQTYSSIAVDMLFEKSASNSRSAELRESDGSFRIWFSYFSQAGTLSRSGNPPHRGGAELLVTRPARGVTGAYWTERSTCGEISSSGRTRNLHNDFKAATVDEYV